MDNPDDITHDTLIKQPIAMCNTISSHLLF